MKHLKPAFAALCACISLAVAGQAENPKPYRILCVGDSITQGGRTGREEYTYRLPLQRLLHDAHVKYDFVGSRNAGLDQGATWPDVAEGVPFDPDHEGYYGAKTESPVVTVQHYKGWFEMPDKPQSDTYDWAHPNPQGQMKMAKAWLNAPTPFLQKTAEVK